MDDITLSQDKLKSLLHYDKDTGIFTRAISRGAVYQKGQQAGSPNGKGYLIIWVDGKRYLAHRLAWFYVYGYFPDGMIDHRNRNRKDNRICNLREATKPQNGQNSKMYSKNTSGCKGVHWHSRDKSWRVTCRVNGVTHQIGYFKDKEKAAEAYRSFAMKNHGEFCAL